MLQYLPDAVTYALLHTIDVVVESREESTRAGFGIKVGQVLLKNCTKKYWAYPFDLADCSVLKERHLCVAEDHWNDRKCYKPQTRFLDFVYYLWDLLVGHFVFDCSLEVSKLINNVAKEQRKCWQCYTECKATYGTHNDKSNIKGIGVSVFWNLDRR